MKENTDLDVNTYLAVTAAMTSRFSGMSLEDIVFSLKNRANSLVRLELEGSKGTIKNNQAIQELENQRQELITVVDNMILALTEVKSAPTKNLTEEQFQERESNIKTLDKEWGNLKKQLQDFDQSLTYLYDVNEDIQDRYRKKMAQYLAEIETINQQKIDMIMSQLKKLNIEIKDPEQLKKALHKFFNSPELQAMFIKTAKEGPEKGFGEKVKGWFK